MNKKLGHMLERSFALFPLALFIFLSYLVYQFVKTSNYYLLVIAFLSFYLIPLTLYRIITFLSPIEEGNRYVGDSGFDSWVASYRLQMLFYLYPCLERWMHLIPGAYSFWLRLWGSKIGKGVIWSPNIEIIDRGLLEIGDQVLFGYATSVSSHIIMFKNNRMCLFLHKVRLATGTLVGGKAMIGPGAKSEPGETVKAMKVFANYGMLNDEIK